MSAPPHRAGTPQGLDHADRRVQSGQRAPSLVGDRRLEQGLDRSFVRSEPSEARAQGPQEILRTGPFPPCAFSHGHGVDISLFQEARAGGPAATHGWIHYLEKPAVTPPRDHEVCQSVRASDHDDRGKRRRFLKIEMLSGHQDLLGVQTQAARRVLDGVD